MRMKIDKQEIWFTSRNLFDRELNPSAWDKYVEWARLDQVIELVSLDGILNDLVFEPNFESEHNEVIYNQNPVTQFFKAIDYVNKKSKHLDYFNLLAVVMEPNEHKADQLERDFEFIGYDLIETDGDISALVNCGGFDETFKPKELNFYGLISDYNRAKEIQIELPKNNPKEHHADCHLFEVWRHKYFGRNSFNIEFVYHLGNEIAETIGNSDQKKLKGWWCDGIDSKRYSKKYINDNRRIETIGWFGKDGQTKFELIINFGKFSLRRFAKGTSMIDCIPKDEEKEWLKLDLDRKIIELQLK